MTDCNIRSSLVTGKGSLLLKKPVLQRAKIHFTRWIDPLESAKKQILVDKWRQLPPELQTENQLLGRHWVGCGYTMGPSYCSFGCSHCYLPKSSNRVPLVPLEEMKEQIVAQRDLLGAGGNIQITGGDVVDAYWLAGKQDELIEVIRFAVENGLVPMLMTHGQILLENPAYFAELVTKGGLRKLSIHIDTTMAGRPGLSVRNLTSEGQLNSLRREFVDLVLQIRKRTGKFVVAAQTITVTEKNIDSIGEVVRWLMSDLKHLDVCRTLSFQPEANVGRTKTSENPVSPDQVWEKICESTGKELSRDHLLVGHPDCSSIATFLVSPARGDVLYLTSQSITGRQFWSDLLVTFGGLGASSTRPLKAFCEKISALVVHPGVVMSTIRYLLDLYRQGQYTKGFLWSAMLGRTRGFNVVMHNFMSDQDVKEPRESVVQKRLDACAFKGVIKIDGEWQAMSMCEMNTSVRPSLYQKVSVPFVSSFD